MKHINVEMGDTKLTCIIGSPVAHSKSPALHNTGYEKLGLDYNYQIFDVKLDELNSAYEDLKNINAAGFNVTMPLKTAICDLVDEKTSAVELIGAANTIVNENGKFVAYNTDGVGFVKALEETGVDVADKKITVLGSGGAASAIIAQSAIDGAKAIDVLARTHSNSRNSIPFKDDIVDLVDKVKAKTGCDIRLIELNDENISKSLSDSHIVANATPVGMKPNEDQCLIDEKDLRADLTVFESVYNPEETILIKRAKEKGCTVVDGLRMLYYQGVVAFKLFTGCDYPE